VGLVLRARERRQQRLNSPAARVGRLGDTLRAGSAVARASAGNTLAGVSEAAELTRRSAVTATGKAAKAAAEQQRKAAAASRRQRASTSSALAVASKTAASQKKAAVRTAAQQRKAAQASLAAASKTAASQRKAARASLAAASKTAAQQRKAVKASLTAAPSRRSSASRPVVAVPRKAKRGRTVRKSLARKLWNTVVLAAGGGGYVLGAKAGRQRYDELAQVAAAVAEHPKVQSATEAVTDPERRADLLLEVQQQASALVGRRGEPRT
jgi:colicin import membrane protein